MEKFLCAKTAIDCIVPALSSSINELTSQTKNLELKADKLKERAAAIKKHISDLTDEVKKIEDELVSNNLSAINLSYIINLRKKELERICNAFKILKRCNTESSEQPQKKAHL